MKEFEDWFEDVVLSALVSHGVIVAAHIQEFPFMYEDYFEQGMSPEQAVVSEWG